MKTYTFGLIGHPLTHSLSPAIHRAALEAVGLEGSYALFPAPPFPDGTITLERLLESLRAGEIDGLNVTIPHKQTVIAFLDRLSPAAAAIGAVNTISAGEGLLTGDNTDAEGFRRDLARTLAPTPGAALILGAGGSARAIAYTLLQDGWRVAVAARRLEQAQALASELPGVAALDGLPPDEAAVNAWGPSLLVNTTPLGTIPRTGETPWPENRPLPAGCAVYDLVYNPRETALLRSARRQGLPAAGGLGMLAEQAALAFEIWTGRRPQVEKLRLAAENALLAMRSDQN